MFNETRFSLFILILYLLANGEQTLHYEINFTLTISSSPGATNVHASGQRRKRDSDQGGVAPCAQFFRV